MEKSHTTNQEIKEETYFDILKKKIKPEYLPSEKELIFMEQATSNVIAQIVAENNGKLPPFIVYPETSARVLPYLFNPSFRKIAEKTNTQTPVTYFMSTFHNDYFGIYSGANEKRESEMEKLKARKVLEKERANEILENAKLRGYGTDTITIIDDTKIGGRTLKSLEDAFVGKNLRHHTLYEEYNKEITDPSVGAGLSFDYIYAFENFRGLGVFWQDENQQKSVGVIKSKDDKYVEKSSEHSHEAMKALRDILSIVGEDVAERLYKDGILESKI